MWLSVMVPLRARSGSGHLTELIIIVKQKARPQAFVFYEGVVAAEIGDRTDIFHEPVATGCLFSLSHSCRCHP